MCKINLNILIAVCVFLAALAGPAGAVTYIVDPNGFKDFTTIQDAIFAASDYDEIEVAPATYNEAINFNGKAVRLYSSGGPEVTIIDANNIGGAYHAVQCVSSEGPNTILEGFTITGGNANGIEPNDQYGGGMFNDSSSPKVRDCIFRGNSADLDGGGMYNDSNSSPTVTNCIFFDNWANFSGGGMCNSNSSPTVTNCTSFGNFAFSDGGGICNYTSSPTVTNCIFWGDFPDSIDDDMASSTTVTYSDVDGGWSGAGSNNIDANPLFANEIGGDLHLTDLSPCVDAGDNNSVPVGVTTDLDGNPRVVDGDRDGNDIVDMGAYELPQPQIHNITQNKWYSTIQAAIDGANGGDEIEVFQGTYNEAINFVGKAITLRSSNPEDPNIVAATVIDGTGNYHVVQCVNSEGPDTILSGFTITGGNANGLPANSYGGGMYNDSNSSPTVRDCIFRGNSADLDGGGMYNDSNSSPAVTNCIFFDNWANFGGGGMCNSNSSPTVTNCTFSGNTASNGGGMFNASSSPTVTNCTFSGNTGGIGVFGSSLLGKQCYNKDRRNRWGWSTREFLTKESKGFEGVLSGNSVYRQAYEL